MFNWTMTFRLDSDFPIPYGWIDAINRPQRQSAPSIREMPYKWLPYNNSEIKMSFKNKNPRLTRIVNKPKGIAWLVSHRNTWSRRNQYVEELQKHIDVDIYGNLGLFCGSRK